MKSLIVIVLLFFSVSVYSQNKYLDSLHREIENIDDSSKVLAYLTIGDYFENNNPDSALFYYRLAEKSAIKCSCEQLIAKSLNYQSLVLINQGLYSEALYKIDSASQYQTDSLLKMKIKYNLAVLYMQTGFYKKAFVEFKKLLVFLSENDYRSYQGVVYFNIALIYRQLEAYDSAFYNIEKAIEIKKEMADTFNIVLDFSMYASIYLATNNYSEAEKYLYQAKDLAIKNNYLVLLSDIYYYLGKIKFLRGLNKEAVAFYLKSLQINKKLGDLSSMIGSYLILSEVSIKTNDLYSAKKYVDSAFYSCTNQTSLNEMEDVYNGVYLFYKSINKADSALKYFELMTFAKDSLDKIDQKNKILILQTEEKIKSSENIILQSRQVIEKNKKKIFVTSILFFTTLVGIFFMLLFLYRYKKSGKKLEQVNKILENSSKKDAIQLALFEIQKKAVLVNEDKPLNEILQDLLETVLNISWLRIERKGVIFIKNKDGILEQIASLNIGELVQKCAFIKPGQCLCGEALQKNDRIIEVEVRPNHTISAEKMTQHGHYIAPIKLGKEIIGVLNIYLEHNYKLTKFEESFFENLCFQIASIIDKKNGILKIIEHGKTQDTLNQKLFAQSLLLEQQKIKVEKASKKIEEQSIILKNTLFNLKSSVNYASYIVNSMLPTKEYMDAVFDDYFLIFKPTEVIGGDFYYVKKIENKIYLSIADATGHGVPGAFLATQGLTFIKGLIDRGEAFEPAEILTQLRIKIKQVFKYAENESLKYSGADMVFCVFDTIKNSVVYSGANNPFTVVRNNKFIKLQATRSPVGAYIEEREFTQQEFQLENNDLIYLQSDGYSDQLGGENFKKIGRKKYEEILLEISGNTTMRQKEILEEKFESWKGKYEQIDDVTVFCLKWHI